MKRGMEITDSDGDRVLIPFDKVVRMTRADGRLWIKMFDPMGVTVSILDKKEIDRVWCEFQAWLTGPVNP